MTLLLSVLTFQVATKQYLCTYVNSTIKLNIDMSSYLDYNNLSQPEENFTKLPNVSKELNNTVTIKTNATENGELPWKPDDPEKELPFAIIVAGPTAAFIVIVFLCVAFYFHNLQLNRNAQKISLTLHVAPDFNSETDEENTMAPLPLPVLTSSETTSPKTGRLSRDHSPLSVRLSRDSSVQALRLTRETSTQNMRLSRDSEIFISPKKSTISLGLPSRGSTLSAFADQEVVNQSAKRKHSIFFV